MPGKVLKLSTNYNLTPGIRDEKDSEGDRGHCWCRRSHHPSVLQAHVPEGQGALPWRLRVHHTCRAATAVVSSGLFTPVGHLPQLWVVVESNGADTTNKSFEAIRGWNSVVNWSVYDDQPYKSCIDKSCSHSVW